MTYLTLSEMVTRYGADALARIATPDDLTPPPPEVLRLAVAGDDLSGYTGEEQAAALAAVERLTAAIAAAADLMDGYLRGRCELPLAAAVVEGSPLPGINADLARYALYDRDPPEAVSERRKAAMAWLGDVAAGRALLPSQQPQRPAGTASLPRFNPGRRVWGGNLE